MKRLRLKYAEREVSAHRDRYGVPHIRGKSWQDALYGLGYLHATDRRTQFLFARIVAQGRAAELLANKSYLVEQDQLIRRLEVTSSLAEELSKIDDSTLNQLQSYCAGVNAGLRQGRRSLPMMAVNLKADPWDPLAVFGMGNLLNVMGLALSQYRGEKLIFDLIRSGVDQHRIQELYSPYLDSVDFELLKQVHSPNKLSDQALAEMAKIPKLLASNAWVVSPEKSETGHALLASDPHLEINYLPAIWYEAALYWEDHSMLGATLPGTPMFAVGRNEKLAWGVTYSMADTCDFFIEDCRVEDGKCFYRREDSQGEHWKEFSTRTEEIKRKKTSAENTVVHTNDLGLLEGDPLEDGPGYYLLSSWTTRDMTVQESVKTWLTLPHCHTAKDGMDLVRYCSQPPLCWLFADQEGHIGMQLSGRFPIRRTPKDGLAPLPAWDEANHWQGWHDPEKLTRKYDPPEGFICEANESVNPDSETVFITLPAASSRYNRIYDYLSEKEKVSLKDCQELQYDVLSYQAKDILSHVLPALPDGPEKEKLANWDYQYLTDSYSATLFMRFYTYLLLEVFGQPSNQGTSKQGGIGRERVLYLTNQKGFGLAFVGFFDRALTNEDSLWWKDRDQQALIQKAWEKAIKHPPQPWGEINEMIFKNTFFSGKLGNWFKFHSKPVALRGCHATPFQGQLVRAGKKKTSLAPSYHFVTDLGTNEAWTNLPGGVSESGFSYLYRSDLQRWIDGEYKSLNADEQQEK